jgi:predicted signal transduction protein with EAL and GGDEF domain
VAGWPSNGLDARALVAASDEALYAAKRAGRDMVVTSTTEAERGPEVQDAATVGS